MLLDEISSQHETNEKHKPPQNDKLATRKWLSTKNKIQNSKQNADLKNSYKLNMLTYNVLADAYT